MDWQAERLRLSAFVEPEAEIASYKCWEDLVGESPEDRRTWPKQNRLRESGAFQEGNLVFTIEPLRLDWNLIFAGRDQERLGEDRESGFPIIGPFADLLAPFQTLMRKWLEEAANIDRLAFGAVLLFPVETLREGYERLRAYLPGVEIDPEGSSDLLYQIPWRPAGAFVS